MRQYIDLEPTEVTFDAKGNSKVVHMTSPETARNMTILPELAAMESLLKNYDYELVNSTNKMRQFIISKLFKMANDAEDEKVSFRALETLGRVTEIGLFTTKIEVSVADKPTSDLEVELRGLLKAYSVKEKQIVEEITDEELRGYDQIEEDDLDLDSDEDE